MNAESPIAWTDACRRIEADPTATVALDRSAWERAGAVFTEVDDGEGERPGLAAATIKTPEGLVTVAVVDYGGDSTYLLVPEIEPKGSATTQAVLDVLAANGIVDRNSDVLDIARVPDTGTLLQRVERLERELEQLRAPRSAMPRTVAHAEAVAAASRGEIATGLGRAERKTGTVTLLDHATGSGYITPDDGGPELDASHEDQALAESAGEPHASGRGRPGRGRSK